MMFSVVIPVYNRAEIIETALDSVFAQSFNDYEVIVVDDGSTDDTGKVVKAYPKPVRLIRQNNAGPGKARNTGIEAAEGEYVAFLDSDDQWFPWTLSTYAQIVKKYDWPSLASSSVRYFQGQSVPKDIERDSLRAHAYKNYLEAAGEGRYIGSGRIVVRRQALEEAGGFATKNMNAEDHDLAFRLGNLPGYVHIAAPALVAVRRHEGQVTQDPKKTWSGFDYILGQEREGAYPSCSKKCRNNRRFLLCQHIRSASIGLAKKGYVQKAINLYTRSVLWQVKFGHIKYVLGFPFVVGWPGLVKSKNWFKKCYNNT